METKRATQPNADPGPRGGQCPESSAFMDTAADSGALSAGPALKPEEAAEQMQFWTGAQKEVADKARELILSNLDRHITIDELSQQLHVSQTQVKVCFHRVYGMPVFSYARRCRMEAAAKRLADTEDSILEIAGQFGYENGSKFATAFRQVMGATPSEYRRRIRWERENAGGSA